ncbi:MAG: imidazoleglycerol-phosphate dehydratase HisB [Kiritimatiellaeota bacterium]|nr:imidazoleglycerol-phosphate dehydratase HisB [Kiritimatiellota bacterium]
MNRTAAIARTTGETQVEVRLDLDAAGRCEIDTGLPFLDHMLGAFSRHGYFKLVLTARGDLEVDPHHTVEDVGLALGQALKEAAGDRTGVQRFGASLVPMDDALVRAVIDLSGRPFLAYDLGVGAGAVGGIPILLFREFFRALATEARLNLHLTRLAGEEPHHVVEAAFKAFGRALDRALGPEPRSPGVPSTKGVLA